MDFAHVADDESRHLGWCLQQLDSLGVHYGDIPAHSVLWDGAQSSAGTSSFNTCLPYFLILTRMIRTPGQMRLG